MGVRHRPSGARQTAQSLRSATHGGDSDQADGAGEQQGLSREQADLHEIGKWDPANVVGSKIKGLASGSHPKLLTLSISLVGPAN